MKDNITDELKKKLEELKDKLDSEKSKEEIIDDTFRNTSKPKLGGTQLTLEFKEDFQI